MYVKVWIWNMRQYIKILSFLWISDNSNIRYFEQKTFVCVTEQHNVSICFTSLWFARKALPKLCTDHKQVKRIEKVVVPVVFITEQHFLIFFTRLWSILKAMLFRYTKFWNRILNWHFLLFNYKFMYLISIAVRTSHKRLNKIKT